MNSTSRSATHSISEEQKQQTREKVEAKIYAAFRSGESIETAAERALAYEVREARREEWSPRTITSMCVLFADVAAEMVTTALIRSVTAEQRIELIDEAQAKVLAVGTTGHESGGQR